MHVMKWWPTEEEAMVHLERLRWKGRPLCPYCQGDKVCVHASRDRILRRWQCQDCHRSFSAMVGTIFHNTHVPLQKWFLAMSLMLNAKKKVSIAQMARDLDLPYKTTWGLAVRIRDAILADPDQKRLFQSIVDID